MPRAREAAAPVRVPSFTAACERSGDIELSGAVFGREPNPALIHEAVKMQLANRRSGTASTKTRGLISGGGRKPWRQKGTGRARAGSTRSPLWRKGGTIFGPQPRDYSYQINKKAWRSAICQAISDRAREGMLLVLESLALPELKTKAAKAMLGKIGAAHALIVVSESERDFIRAARNLAKHKVLAVEGLNVYDVLAYDQLVMTAATARAIEGRLGRAEK